MNDILVFAYRFDNDTASFIDLLTGQYLSVVPISDSSVFITMFQSLPVQQWIELKPEQLILFIVKPLRNAIRWTLLVDQRCFRFNQNRPGSDLPIPDKYWERVYTAYMVRQLEN